MPGKPNPSADIAAEAAIRRVLSAEREARDAVAAAKLEATAIVENARASATNIAERTDRRVQRLREAFVARASREIAVLESETTAQDARSALSTQDLARVERAVAALCAELTSGPP